MTILPQQNHLLVSLHEIKPEGVIVVADKSSVAVTYGKVIALGLDCTLCNIGDKVLFLPQNMIAGFDEHAPDPKFIVPESAVFAKIVLEGTN